MSEDTSSVSRLVRYVAVFLFHLTLTSLCLGFDLEGSQTSYAAFGRWNPCLNGSISFEFKTDQPNALLMYTDDGGKYDFFEVKLVGGIVRLRLNLGDGTVILTAGHDLNDMQWHKVKVIRSVEQTTVVVDEMSQSRSSKGTEFAFGDYEKNSRVHFGGMPIEYSALLSNLALPSVMFEPRFRGSIRNIFYSNCGNAPERPVMVDFQGIRNSDEDQCDQNNHPCENGGICVSRDSGAQCDCSRTEFEGERCQTAKVPSEATFFGAHYLSYDLSSRGDPIVSNEDKISLHFKSRQANGLLFYTGDGADYLNIALRNGEIAVSMNLGSGVYTSAIQPIKHQRFDDNQWHHLEVQRHAREIEMFVDGRMQDYGTASGDFTLLSSNILYVAGSPNTATLPGSLVPNNFKGCLKKVEYKADSIVLDLLDLARTQHNLINIVGDVLFDKCHDMVESQPITFTSPESFISLPRWQVEKNGSLSFNFQTTEPNGVIMYHNNAGKGNSDFFALEILDGNLYLILDLGSGPVKVKTPSRSLTDGLPHSVLVNLEGQRGYFKVDGNKVDFTTPGPDDRLDLEGHMFVGGISNHGDAHLLPADMWAGMLGFGFVGCLQDLILNGEKVDLAQVAKEQSAEGIAEYCRGMEPQCLSQPCTHRGVCEEGWNRFVCDCRATGYIGPVCQKAATTLKFDGSQHMKISLPEESRTEAEDISLRFKTIYPNGLLFVTTTRKSEDSMELTVSGGSIRFSLNLGGSRSSLTVGSDVNDGHWHVVYIKRRARDIEIRIDDHRPQRDKLQADDYTFEYTSIIFGSTAVTVEATVKARRHSTYMHFESLEVGNMMLSDDNSLRAPTSYNGEMQQFVFNNNEFIELASSGDIQNIELTATINSQEIIKDPVTFKSKGAYVILPQFQAYSSFTLYFKFRTTEADGLIFYNDGKEQDFIAVELSDGHLFYSFSVGAGSSRVKIESPSKLNDNEWHDVSILRPDHSQHVLRVDNAPATVHKSRETQIVHFDLSGPLYVGGVKKTMYSSLPRSVKARAGYQGCLASLDMNSQVLNLMSKPDRIVGSVAEGCQGPTVLCETDSCVNSGRCVQQWNSLRCNCDLTSYTGPRCTDESISYRFGPGEGLITYSFPDGKHPKTTYDELALGFITNEPDAILLRIDSATADDYIEMELVQGNIFVVYNMGNDDHPVAELFAKVSDGKYHVVRFTRTGPNSTIQVDNMLVQPKNPKGRQLSMFNDQAMIQIGGKKNKEGRIERPFHGIMSGLVFNGKRLLDLADQKDAQVSIEGAVEKDNELGKHIQPEPKLETVEDLVKAGWQSTEGVRRAWTTVPAPVFEEGRQTSASWWGPEFSGFGDPEETSGSGSGVSDKPTRTNTNKDRFTNLFEKPVDMRPGEAPTSSPRVTSAWYWVGNPDFPKHIPPGFVDMEGSDMGKIPQAHLANKPSEIQNGGARLANKPSETLTGGANDPRISADSVPNDLELDLDFSEEGVSGSGSGSGFSQVENTTVSELPTTTVSLHSQFMKDYEQRLFRWKVEQMRKEHFRSELLNKRRKKTEGKVIPLNKPVSSNEILKAKSPARKVPIEPKWTGFLTSPRTDEILGTMAAKHTTPRQDVTDEIIFAGEGSGCHSDEEDDCTDVVSGHEDDIITPTVIIRTTPKPKTTTTTASKQTPCDDEDSDSCDGSGSETQPTKKPTKGRGKNKKNRNNHKTSAKPPTRTKGPTGSASNQPTSGTEVTVNITVPLDVGTGENRDGATGRPVKTDDRDNLNLGLIIGIVAGVLVALIILIYALYKFRSREEGSYKVDETQNFAYVNEPKKAPLSTNGGLKPNNNCPPSKTGKKRDVKEWYV